MSFDNSRETDVIPPTNAQFRPQTFTIFHFATGRTADEEIWEWRNEEIKKRRCEKKSTKIHPRISIDDRGKKEIKKNKRLSQRSIVRFRPQFLAPGPPFSKSRLALLLFLCSVAASIFIDNLEDRAITIETPRQTERERERVCEMRMEKKKIAQTTRNKSETNP